MLDKATTCIVNDFGRVFVVSLQQHHIQHSSAGETLIRNLHHTFLFCPHSLTTLITPQIQRIKSNHQSSVPRSQAELLISMPRRVQSYMTIKTHPPTAVAFNLATHQKHLHSYPKICRGSYLWDSNSVELRQVTNHKIQARGDIFIY